MPPPLLDATLAELYGVETHVLVRAVTHTEERFPPDFMFQLTDKEFQRLRSQSVIPGSGQWGGRRSPPYDLTEQGVARLSSVRSVRPREREPGGLVEKAIHEGLKGLVSSHQSQPTSRRGTLGLGDPPLRRTRIGQGREMCGAHF